MKNIKKEPKKEEKVPEKVVIVDQSKVVFKVQFASSETELNLKQEKFSSVVDGSYYKLKGILKYTSGNFAQLKDAVNHQSLLREKGFKDCFVIAMKNGERIDLNEAKKQAGQ